MSDPPERFLWLRHAFLGRDSKSAPDELETEWVGLLRETQQDGSVEYCVEHLDSKFNEIYPDECFPTEAEAQAHAEAEYELSFGDWRPGPARDTANDG
jgi:hypothetical protein